MKRTTHNQHKPHAKVNTSHRRAMLTAEQARFLLHAMDCTVELKISTKVYETNHDDTSFELIYVKGFNEYVHFHNIKSIKCLNLELADPEADFIAIDWSTDN